MAMQTGGDRDEPVTGINVTPLVDVCLVLVIIFMVTAPILNQSTLSVDLPKAKTKEGEEKSNVTITITKDKRWAVNEQEIAADEIEKVLPARIRQTPDKLVVIKADQEALHGELLSAMRAAKNAGAKSITIATVQK
ncbi:MAG: biopolymer transporter ExbD [Elusimicrobia bacterium]|nr:biopolymer transporter ExbD [Elusimicrobiota bacterium]